MQGQPRRIINNHWCVGSGCSKHMLGDISLLHTSTSFNTEYVSFKGDKGGKVRMAGTFKFDAQTLKKIDWSLFENGYRKDQKDFLIFR